MGIIFVMFYRSFAAAGGRLERLLRGGLDEWRYTFTHDI